MRSHIQLVNLFLLPLAVSAGQSEPRVQLASFIPLKANDFSVARVSSSSLLGRQTCPGGYCEGDCMEVGGTCCNDGNGYCEAGYYCTATACCKKGQVCTGTPPPSVGTGTGTGSCGITQSVCDDGCMPLGNTCCNDGTGSCKPGFYCTATACCRIGQTCDEPPSNPSGTLTGGGATATSNPTGTVTTKPATTSSSDDDDSTFTFGSLSLTFSGLDDDETSTTSSTRSTRSTTATAGASTPTIPPPPAAPGAGAQLEPNAQLAAGLVGALAGAAALLF